ncbi:MAG: hypothetical protein ABJC66_16000 [Gammaproteobacteria bacterium]
MEQSRWGLRRYATLLGVVFAHMALLAAMMMGSRAIDTAEVANQSVELLYLPPAKMPRVRAENSLPRRLSSDTAIPIAPPVFDSTATSPSPAASGSNGNGTGVDWRAEARRAVQAFEIRSHRPKSEYSMPGSAAEDNWWPQGRHFAGEQYRDVNGDWIVWINASCYQVASAGASAQTPGVLLPQTICPGESANPRGGKTGVTNRGWATR